MFFNKSKKSTLMFSKSTQKLSKCLLGALLLWVPIKALALFSRSSHVFMCVCVCVHSMCACTHCCLLACLLDYCFFFVFLIHYIFLILKKTWISLGNFKLLLSCVSILFWSFASQDKPLCIVFSSTKVALEKYPWFFLGGFIPCLMFWPFSWMWQMTTK